jgi:hypothetical protein
MFHSLAKSIVYFGIGVTLLPAGSNRARACTLCLGFPEKTAADYLIEADCVVLARESENEPFSYAPLEYLKGGDQGDDIDLLVDSQTRRLLRADHRRKVVLVRKGNRGSWRSFGIATQGFEAVVRRVVLNSETWKGKQGAQRRWEFFSPLFGQEDPSIGQLAYLEMGRAPYAVIKKLGRVASREDFVPLLTDPKYLEWRSLAILLLAQSNAPRDQQHILDSFHNAHRFGLTTSLAAWAAAAIEVQGADAISVIEDQYFCGTDRSQEEVQAVARALSMHGSQEGSGLRDRIVTSYGVLLEHSSQFAQQVADDLYAWKRSELVEKLSEILKDDASLGSADRQSIRRYLRATSSVEERSLVRD